MRESASLLSCRASSTSTCTLSQTSNLVSTWTPASTQVLSRNPKMLPSIWSLKRWTMSKKWATGHSLLENRCPFSWRTRLKCSRETYSLQRQTLLLHRVQVSMVISRLTVCSIEMEPSSTALKKTLDHIPSSKCKPYSTINYSYQKIHNLTLSTELFLSNITYITRGFGVLGFWGFGGWVL